jgi:uncharacterized protein YjdB
MSVRSSSARTLASSLLYPLVRRRSPRSKLRATARWLALIAITQQISCGGGGTPTNSNVDLPPVVTVSISPPSAQISAGTSVQFTATVQNASNPAVSWQLNGLPGGNSSVGTVTPSGAATASYTAPANVSGALTVTVAAVLQADATKFGSATVTINPLPNARITVSPANTNVVAGETVQFSATVQNGPQAVIWEVDGIQLGNSTIGFISSSGFYTAPALIPNPPVVTITAILETDISVSGSTNLTIVAPPVSVSISPSTANVAAGQTLQFSASVQNSNAPMTWEVNGAPGGDPADGTIIASGTYTATYSAPNVSAPLTVSVTAVLQSNPQRSASAGVTIVPLGAFTGVYSWRNDNSLTGQNPQETMLTPSSVSSTTSPIFGKLFGCPVDGQIFAQPLYVANVTIANVTHNVVYVATEHDSVYAFDADNLCQTLWQVSFIDLNAGVTTVPASDINGQVDILPEIGITGTPVIDANTATLYVVAKTKVNEGGNFVYRQKLHALDLATGAEKLGGPATIQATVSGTGDGSGKISFDSLTENQRSALLLAAGNVYVAFDSYGDTDPFHGWLLAYDASDLAKGAVAVFNSTPNGSHGGIGENGAAPSSDASGNVFVVTSDGTFDSFSDYAETLLKLQINTGFTIANPSADTFTPADEFSLNSTQRYFGSTGVLLLPDSLGSAVPLAIAGSEAGSLYLLNRNNLGGFTPGGPDNVVQTLCLTANGASGVPASILGTPAYWAATNTVYLAADFDNLKAFPLASGKFSLPTCPAAAVPSSHSNDTFALFGASPAISSNGSTGGIIWALDTSGYAGSAGTSSPAVLHAYDATNLAKELYVSPSSTGGAALPAGPAVKFAVPTVANGKVYVGTQNELSVFGLLP